MTLVSGWGRRRDHNNERPQLGPPVPQVVKVEPIIVAPVLPEPDLTSPIAPDQEMADAHRWDIEKAYYLGSMAFGHEFGVAWAAYVAGLLESDTERPRRKWTMREIRRLTFLKATRSRWQ